MGLLGGARRRGRRRGLVVGAAIGSAASRRSAKEDSQQAADAPATDDTATQLEKLAKLKDEGILTQEEFDAKKKQILGL